MNDDKEDFTCWDFTENKDLNDVVKNMNDDYENNQENNIDFDFNIDDEKMGKCKHEFGVEMITDNNITAVIRCKKCSFYKKILLKDVKDFLNNGEQKRTCGIGYPHALNNEFHTFDRGE